MQKTPYFHTNSVVLARSQYIKEFLKMFLGGFVVSLGSEVDNWE